MTIEQIPNLKSLSAGVLLTLGFAAWLTGNRGMDGVVVFFVVIVGLPVAFLFLMFNNPKDSGDIDWGTASAMPFCAIFWPVLALTLVASKPWNDRRWRERNVEHTPAEAVVEDAGDSQPGA